MAKARGKEAPPEGITFHTDDRSVALRLRDAEGKPNRIVTLPEPGALQLIQMQTLLDRVDAKMPTVPETGTGEVSAEIATEITRVHKEQNAWVYGDDAPYGAVLIELIAICNPDEKGKVEIKDLPGWGLSPMTARAILQHFKTPLAGTAAT